MDRENVINEFKHCIQIGGWMNCRSCKHKNAQPVLTCETLAKEILVMMKEQPKIVRCKDCKHYSWHTDSCDHIGGIVSKDFFCADGERREEE